MMCNPKYERWRKTAFLDQGLFGCCLNVPRQEPGELAAYYAHHDGTIIEALRQRICRPEDTHGRGAQGERLSGSSKVEGYISCQNPLTVPFIGIGSTDLARVDDPAYRHRIEHGAEAAYVVGMWMRACENVQLLYACFPDGLKNSPRGVNWSPVDQHGMAIGRGDKYGVALSNINH